MPSIYDIKPQFQGLLRPCVQKLAKLGVTANQITLLACVLSVGVGALLYRTPDSKKIFWLITFLFFVRMALNAIDGMLAREHNMKTPLGAILNELTDVISDAALYLPFACVSGFSPPLIVIIVVLAVISEMTGVVAIQIGASRRYEGPMGKSDRAFVFGVFALLIALEVSYHSWMPYVLSSLIVLLGLTIFNRSRKALAEVKP